MIAWLIAQATTTSAPAVTEMTAMGWVFMITSITSVTILVSFCYFKVLTRPSTVEHMHAPLDIDTRDQGT